LSPLVETQLFSPVAYIRPWPTPDRMATGMASMMYAKTRVIQEV
jgi:hypothetical protein